MKYSEEYIPMTNWAEKYSQEETLASELAVTKVIDNKGTHFVRTKDVKQYMAQEIDN